MPLNSVKCPKCGCHINYAVDIEAAEQTIVCRRCKNSFVMKQSDLDPTIQDTVQQLLAQRQQEQAERDAYVQESQNEEESVDDALDKAQAAFSEAKERLLGLADQVNDLTDTMGIINEFTVGEAVDDLGSLGGSKAATAKSKVATVANAVAQATVDEPQVTASGQVVFQSKEQMAVYYAKELYRTCKSHGFKLTDALADTQWQHTFIKTLKVDDSVKNALDSLVDSDGFQQRLITLATRYGK